MATIFNEILYRPFLNALILFYDYVPLHDFGIAVILLTILIRLILFPLFYKGARDQAIIQRLAPRVKEIQGIHKNDKQEQARALMELYREHRVNPLSGFLLLFIQLPVLIALYGVFLRGFSSDYLGALYGFVPHPTTLNHFFLGFVDLTQRNILIVLLAAMAQYFQGKLSLPPDTGGKKELSGAEAIGRQMVYMGPVLTVVFLYFLNLPSAVGLYWLTTSAFSVVQQVAINKRIAKYFENDKSSRVK